jgi:hypothetical protein
VLSNSGTLAVQKLIKFVQQKLKKFYFDLISASGEFFTDTGNELPVNFANGAFKLK